MKSVIAPALFLASLLTPALAQQNAPLPLPAPTPAPNARPETGSVSKKAAEGVNAEIVAARAATKDKKFADAEALMLKVTSDSPNLVVPWVELGLAQIGLKKYSDAENSFKIALGIDPASLKRAHSDDFYVRADEPGVVAPSATRASRNTAGGGEVNTGEKRTPDIIGTSYASLGEIYIRGGKAQEAEAQFDNAVKSNPAEAALYRRNETIFFFQVGNADEQLKAANQAIAIDPTRAMLYYFKGQALVSKATIDPSTQKMTLPPGCAEAYQKYLELDPNGPYSADAKGVLSATGIPLKAGKK